MCPTFWLLLHVRQPWSRGSKNIFNITSGLNFHYNTHCSPRVSRLCSPSPIHFLAHTISSHIFHLSLSPSPSPLDFLPAFSSSLSGCRCQSVCRFHSSNTHLLWFPRTQYLAGIKTHRPIVKLQYFLPLRTNEGNEENISLRSKTCSSLHTTHVLGH